MKASTVAIVVLAFLLLISSQSRRRHRVEKEEYLPPLRARVGQVWYWQNSKNPFDRRTRIRIVNIKDGYFQYYFVGPDGKDMITGEPWSSPISYLRSAKREE